MVSFDTEHEPRAVAVPVDLVKAKRPGTGERRIARAIEMLLDDGHEGARG